MTFNTLLEENNIQNITEQVTHQLKKTNKYYSVCALGETVSGTKIFNILTFPASSKPEEIKETLYNRHCASIISPLHNKYEALEWRLQKLKESAAAGYIYRSYWHPY